MLHSAFAGNSSSIVSPPYLCSSKSYPSLLSSIVPRMWLSSMRRKELLLRRSKLYVRVATAFLLYTFLSSYYVASVQEEKKEHKPSKER